MMLPVNRSRGVRLFFPFIEFTKKVTTIFNASAIIKYTILNRRTSRKLPFCLSG